MNRADILDIMSPRFADEQVQRMERARLRVVDRSEPPPVDVMAWLEAKPVQERNDYIWDAMAEAHFRSEETMLRDFRQITGSQWGQRALEWLQRVAEKERT